MLQSHSHSPISDPIRFESHTLLLIQLLPIRVESHTLLLCPNKGVFFVVFLKTSLLFKSPLFGTFLNTSRVRRFGDGKNCPKERGDLDSKQHAEVHARTDEAAAGGDTSDPAEGGSHCSQATSNMDGMIHSRLESVGKRMDLWLVRT